MINFGKKEEKDKFLKGNEEKGKLWGKCEF
jgi:hypothetical protein